LCYSLTHDYWQIQDAKQRSSEMIRAIALDGPQIITRHGEEVAVVVDIAQYRRLTKRQRSSPVRSRTDWVVTGLGVVSGTALRDGSRGTFSAQPPARPRMPMDAYRKADTF
jgi:prevent-host-death family protein